LPKLFFYIKELTQYKLAVTVFDKFRISHTFVKIFILNKFYSSPTMRKILTIVVISFIVIFTFKYCVDKKEDRIVLQESSALIQKQIKNVGKLIVTEGHFSEVFNYRNSKEIFGSFFTSEKKALIVVNADVFVSYDLSLIEYSIDEKTKTLTILSIPEEEININPDLENYDIQAEN